MSLGCTPFGQNFERYPGSFDRFSNASSLIKAYHTDYDILTFIQKTIIPMPNAAGLEMIPELDTPFDLVMTGNAAIIGAGIGSGQGWVATFGLLNGGATMVEAHGHPSILYGLLVEEDNLGNIVKDALGYPVYFP